MRLRVLLIINAIVAIVYGIGLLLLPAQLGSLYGFTSSPPLIYVARLLGGYLFAVGLLSWLIKDAPASPIRTAIVFVFLAMDLLGFLISLVSQIDGTLNALGWSSVVIYLLLGLGFVYFLFVKPASA